MQISQFLLQKNFCEIPWNSFHFGVLGASGPQNNKIGFSRHVFKAEKVRFWEVFLHFAISALFAPKIDFLRNFKENGIFSVFGPQNQLFRLGASKKAPRTLRLSLVLRRGRPSPILGPKEHFWAPKPEKGWNSPYFAKMAGTAPEKYRNLDFG